MLIEIKKQLNGANVRLYEKLDQNLFSFRLEDKWSEGNYQEVFDVLWSKAENSKNISEFNKNIHLYFGIKRKKRNENKKRVGFFKNARKELQKLSLRGY